MARSGKTFSVDTEPDKAAVVESLTRDVSVEACVYDLVDNSIDAARDTFLRSATAGEALPDSYEVAEIKLALGGDGLTIEDNCGGIPVDRLKKMVLRFGKRSEHESGIGVFGVGLNRAIFKLGRVTHLRTDTGTQRAELVLNAREYLKTDGWDLPAEEFPSTGKIGTEIEIRQPPEDISSSFSDTSWIQRLRYDMGRRYGRFIAKGLSLVVNATPVANEEVPIREGGPYEGQHKDYRTDDGVAIHIRYGQHREHRFSNEPGYSRTRNAALTSQFGWTLLCNDRAILISDRSPETGWEKFHTEFYGFVGCVNFVSSDPLLLPWDTTKADVDENNHAYRLALEDMRKFTAAWRSLAEQRKHEPAPKPIPPKPPPSTVAPPGPKAPPATTKKPPVKKTIAKVDHQTFRTVLPDDVGEQHCEDKLLRLVHEAKALDLGDLTYSGMALIRMLFESSMINYLLRTKSIEQVKKFAAERRRKSGMKMPADEERRLPPTFDEMLVYFDANPAICGADKATYLKHSLKRMLTHQGLLNGVLHQPLQTINTSKAFEIRDDVLPVLRHLIETGEET